MFYKQFDELCKENNTSPTAFTKDVLKLSSSKVTAWKNGAIPKFEILESIATYFGVTVGYLFDGKKSPLSELSENEQRMLALFKDLSLTQQGEIIARTEIML